MRKLCYVLLVVLLLSSAFVAEGSTPASAAVNAVGTVRCKLRADVTFSPPIRNVARAGVTWSLVGQVACRTGTTGLGKATAKRGLIQARSNPGTFSCDSTRYPPVTAIINWRTNNGTAISPTVITWNNPVSRIAVRHGLSFATNSGQVSGSYAGQNNWFKFVGRNVPHDSCATAAGLPAYRVTNGGSPNALWIGTCGNGLPAPARYDHVVVFQFQNRSWPLVGGPGFTTMPYLRSLASSCNYFRDYTEADKLQGSMVQNIAQMTGAVQPNASVNCVPSAQCFSTADNIFRQLRRAGRTAVNYVEGTSSGCQPAPGFLPGWVWPHWVPYLYFKGADDPAFCNTHVRPYSEFNPNALPAFSFITPTECNLGHFPSDWCANPTVDNWARANISRVLNTAAYRAGRVAVFVWYDEDFPTANMQITPTARTGTNGVKGMNYGSTLRAWQSMLGLPCLGMACFAPNMRPAANI